MNFNPKTIEERIMQILNRKPTTHQTFEKLANHLTTEFIKGSKNFIFDAAVSISTGKSIKDELINSTLKNEIIFYSDGLPSGILPPNSYNFFINIFVQHSKLKSHSRQAPKF